MLSFYLSRRNQIAEGEKCRTESEEEYFLACLHFPISPHVKSKRPYSHNGSVSVYPTLCQLILLRMQFR